MTVLTFFVAKLVVDGGQKKAMLYLRHKCANDEEADITASEGSMTAFCFPLGPESVVPKEYMASEEYTFTLTGGDGKRYQGFCRKFLPPKPAVGSKQQLPQVLCLMSEDPWATFYFKVLQVLEQLVKSGDGLLGSDAKQLPDSSHAAMFLRDLGTQLQGNPRPSEIVRVALPKSVDLTGVSPHRLLGNPSGLSEEYLELQVPLDCGNGRWNCGVSLARLLWDVPIPALTTLLASMLLERRIILVSSQRDTVTAAVQAASALLYPFKWHHIYLPMLPQAFKDYLSAPMPFMVGLQSQMLGMLSSIPMDEITVIDLDIRSCKPAPGSPTDDARGLPWREQLEAALTAAHKLIRSPTEHETSPLIASIIQEFFVKLFGNYRRFIHADTPALNAKWAAQVASPSGATPQNSPRLHRESMSGRAPGAEAGERSGHGAGSSTRGVADNVMKAAGYVFEHTAFVRSHRRNEKARTFLAHLRGSQLYAMFVQERLEEAAAAAQGRGDDALADDPFEQRVDRYQVRRRMRFDKLRASKGGSAITRQWNNLIKKHRRTDSEEAAMMSNLDLGGSAGLAASMRRIITCPSGNMAGQQLEVDPALFFPEDDEDDYEDLQEATSHLGRLDTGQGGRVLSASAAQPTTSPPHLERNAASFAVPGSSGLHAHSLPAANHRLAAVSSPAVRVGSYGAQPAGPGTAAVEDTRQGVNITVAQGTLGDKFKSAVTDLTSAIGRRVNSTSAATSNMAAAAGLAASNTIAAAATFTSNLTSSSSSGYRQQLTGDNNQPKGGLARYMPQSTGGGLSLLDMANGRLKPPPSSARPLLLPQQQGSSSPIEAQQGPASSAAYEGPQLGRTSAAASSGGLPTQPAVPSQPVEPAQQAQQAQQGPGLAAGLLSQRLSGANSGLQTVASGRGGVAGGPQGTAPLPAIPDTSPLIDGFDGFALLASAHVEPPRSQPSGTQAVSLLDL